ncbi:MAG TPA: polyhydroxyalkanoic acid system family protein [Anaeromyxobacteraceae bacterium]|nr:polyhydroxyalkanoic acid system family protein [Anaeromyxobacteraceae bacterium]
MSVIVRKYPGKKAQEIYEAVDGVMERLTVKMGLNYEKDPGTRAGTVSKMGICGRYLAKEGEVTVDLHFPMLLPGPMKRRVQENIERRLDALFV